MPKELAFSALDLLEVYRKGMFPMSDAANDPEVYLVRPQRRGVIFLDDFRVPRSLRKFLRDKPFDYSFDKDFIAVIEGCASVGGAVGADLREDTWINGYIKSWFKTLHSAGFAHSVEVWDAQGKLVGGLYGLALGAVFFGESMFSRTSQASKAALVFLVEHLKAQGFTLLDCQFVNPHLMQFGCVEIDADEYQALLDAAVAAPVSFSV